MLRPVIDDPEEARESLADVMEETSYPYTAQHLKILDNAFVVSIIDESRDVLAGYMWFYRIEGELDCFALHVLVLTNYKKKFFSRTLVNSILGLLWAIGCNKLIVENANQEFLIRIGGFMNEEGEACLPLPHTWRSKWQSQLRV